MDVVIREKLDEALALYLKEYGSQGYDSTDFVDYVVAYLKLHVADDQPSRGTPDMSSFYAMRAVYFANMFEAGIVTDRHLPKAIGGT